MDEQQVLIEAFSKMAPQYESKVDRELRRFWGWSYRALVDRVLELTPIYPHDRVLDIATGTSVIPLRLLQTGNRPASITGLDITYRMLKAGQGKVGSVCTAAPIFLTCGSAMRMPYRDGAFDLILCGLATHHMDLPALLAETSRVIAPHGRVTIADVGGSAFLKLPGAKFVVRLAAFLYFLMTEGPARARAEAGALPHVFTAAEWTSHLVQAGFSQVQVTRLETDRKWSPAPLILRACKC
jgi:ubiquinone/menaquinone biosynthesis C-methylase UbiE